MMSWTINAKIQTSIFCLALLITNSLVERAIDTVKHVWKKVTDEQQSKSSGLWMYRSSPFDSKKLSPHKILFGRKP